MGIFAKKTKTTSPSTSSVKNGEVKKPLGGHFVRSVLSRPHASEKAFGLHDKSQYVFFVSRDANKVMVREEVSRRYNVTVVSVNMIVDKGKTKHYRGRETKAKIQKKAIVTLKKGDKIEIV